VNANELKSWFFEQPFVDASFFDPAHMNIIAAPRLGKGATDPLNGKARSGIIRGAADVVEVPEHFEMRTRRRSKGAGTAGGKTFDPSPRFAEALGAIGDHPGGHGCYQAFTHAVAKYFHEQGAAGNQADLHAMLVERSKAATWVVKEHPPAYVAEK